MSCRQIYVIGKFGALGLPVNGAPVEHENPGKTPMPATTANGLLASTTSCTMSQITRYAPESVFPTIGGWPDQSINHHRQLLAALESRDGNRASQAMSDHLAAEAVPLIDHLTERGVVHYVQ